MPSGHASATLSVVLPLYLGHPIEAGAPVLALALIVGLSRCYVASTIPGTFSWGGPEVPRR